MRAGEAAAAAEQADAADHRGGDRGQDVVLADGRRAGAGLGREVERAPARRTGRTGRRSTTLIRVIETPDRKADFSFEPVAGW